jgi:hypothetical protein
MLVVNKRRHYQSLPARIGITTTRQDHRADGLVGKAGVSGC